MEIILSRAEVWTVEAESRDSEEKKRQIEAYYWSKNLQKRVHVQDQTIDCGCGGKS
jgi:hypothetical protein